jgi:endonuclease III
VILEQLARSYGSPRLGNPQNPLDDLFFILLSKKTPPERYCPVFEELRRRYRPWRKLLDAPLASLAALLAPLGLSNTRAKQFLGVARKLQEDFGRVSLAPLRHMTQQEAAKYLTSLPGVGEKSARCVMMYTLGYDISPMDAHAIRVLSRLGFLPRGSTPKSAHQIVDERIPKGLSYRLHVNIVSHGRAICTAQRPKCYQCMLVRICPSSQPRVRRGCNRDGKSGHSAPSTMRSTTPAI